MANRKYAYDDMEREYVQSDTLSMRELARRYGVPNYSLVHQYAKSHKWEEKRTLRMSKTDEKVIERYADRAAKRADKLEDAFDATVDLIIESIEKVRRDIRETPDKVQVAPRDLALLIDRLLVMKGQPSQITEERNLGLSLSGPVGSEQLAAILELTRGTSVHQRVGSGGSAIPRAEGPRNH